jgi:hypothetical protein
MNRNLPKWLWAVLSITSAMLLGIVDWLTGYELNISVFYFIPVSLGA